MVVIEQLRVAPDGQKLFIDAHVNKASYFDNLELDRISIDSQDTVLQTFDGPSNKAVFIYNNEPSSHIIKTTETPIVLSEHKFIQALDEESLILNIVPKEEANKTYITLGFRGEYHTFHEGILALQVTALGHPKSLMYIQGTQKDPERALWEFKSKFDLGSYTQFTFTLVEMTATGDVYPVPFTDTINVNTLHFIYDIYTEYLIQNTKEIHLVIDKSEIDADLSKDMLYVYFHVTGTPSSNTPCRLDESYTLGVTFNEGAIYNRMMGYTKEIVNTCEVPKGFIDMILQLEAIKTSIETENYVSANKFYNRLMNNKSSKGTSNISCGCHG